MIGVIIRLKIKENGYNNYEYALDQFCETIADDVIEIEIEEIE